MHTRARRIKWLHIENVDTLHLSQKLKTLQTSSLFEVCGDSPGRSAGRKKIFFGLDLCYIFIQSANTYNLFSPDHKSFQSLVRLHLLENS
jgi:hypothetical protein